MRQLPHKQPAENQAQAPRNQRRQHRKKRHQRHRAPRRLRNSRQSLNRAIHNRRRRHHIPADNNHHHLHGERHQRPEILSSLDRQFRRTLPEQQPRHKHNHNSHQRKDQRIRKPSLAPVRQSQSKPHQSLFPNGNLFLFWIAHTEPPRFGSELRESQASPRRGSPSSLPLSARIVTRVPQKKEPLRRAALVAFQLN